MPPGGQGLAAFGLQEATIIALLLALLGLAYRFGHQQARIEQLDTAVRAIHRRLDEFRELIGKALAERG